MKATLTAGLAVLAVTACFSSRSQPKPAKLDPASAKALDVIFAGGVSEFCHHGAPPQLKAIVTLTDGKRLETWSAGSGRDGKLLFDAFEWSTSYGKVSGSGRLLVPADPFAAIGREIVVIARVAERPELERTATIRVNFDCDGVAGVSGMSGTSGSSGWSGKAGQRGQNGDQNRIATDGQSGTHGQEGESGRHGQPGGHLEAAVGYVDAPPHGRLMLVRVGSRHFLLKPNRRFLLAAAGGAGGSGGSGGRGGNGGGGGDNSHAEGTDGGSAGDGGDGGRAGNGGDGADGGSIHLVYDKHNPELTRQIILSVAGGLPGRGGSGGSAGNGGSGGSSSKGRRGMNGRAGQRGQSGSDGRPGRPGQAPVVVPGDPQLIFAAEIELGLPIVVP